MREHRIIVIIPFHYYHCVIASLHQFVIILLLNNYNIQGIQVNWIYIVKLVQFFQQDAQIEHYSYAYLQVFFIACDEKGQDDQIAPTSYYKTFYRYIHLL